MGTPPLVALALLAGALPLCAWVGVSDMARMRIPNRAVMALVAVYAVVGLLCLPLDGWTLGDWSWRWLNLAVILLIGMTLNAANMVGAGDAKFAAAAAPFVAAGDAGRMLMILAGAMLAAWALHRAAKHSVGPRLAPTWKSWTSGKRFPMGVALGLALIAYLGLAAAA